MNPEPPLCQVSQQKCWSRTLTVILPVRENFTALFEISFHFYIMNKMIIKSGSEFLRMSLNLQ